MNIERVKTDNRYREVYVDETVVDHEPEEEKKSLATNNSFLLAQQHMEADYKRIMKQESPSKISPEKSEFLEEI